MSIISSIYSRSREPLSPAEQDEAARAAWHSGADLIGLRISDIRDEWTRQAVINEATRQYGARSKRAGRAA